MKDLTYDDFVGNKRAVEKVKLLTHHAIGDNLVRIPDIGFYGPSGHGKNTLARIVANELGRNFIEINSTSIRDPFQFRSIILDGSYNATGRIVHLDECHQLPKKIQDNLLSVTEAPRELHTSKSDQTFVDKLQENISFIFSTTHCGLLRKALRSRLESVEFVRYSVKELLDMTIKYLIREYDMKLESSDKKALVQIARRARNGRDVRKFCDNVVRQLNRNGESRLNLKAVLSCFNILGIDKHGFTSRDRKLLKYLAEYNSCVGLETLEAVMSIGKKEIKTNIEPFLLQRGYIERSRTGRIITQKGKDAIAEKGQS